MSARCAPTLIQSLVIFSYLPTADGRRSGEKLGASALLDIFDHFLKYSMLLHGTQANADIILRASTQVPTFIDSFAAPLSLINALVTHVGKERKHDVDNHFEKMEEVWEKLGIFYENGNEEGK